MPSLLTLADVMGTGHHAAVVADVGPSRSSSSAATKERSSLAVGEPQVVQRRSPCISGSLDLPWLAMSTIAWIAVGVGASALAVLALGLLLDRSLLFDRGAFAATLLASMVWAAIMFVLLGGGYYVISNWVEDDDGPPGREPVIGLLSDEDGAEELQPGRAERGGQARRGEPAGDGVTLRVAPLGETYVCVENADGDQVFEQTIAAPETFKGNDALRVSFGNTQVDLELNGDEVPIEQGANPVGYEFTPEGEEELSETERPCT